MNTYYSGNKIDIQATLLFNKAPLPLSGKVVTANLVTDKYRERASGTSPVVCTQPGDPGVVIASFPSYQTVSIVEGLYYIEFTTDDGPYTHEGELIRILKGVA
jgi:hypothetical protein